MSSTTERTTILKLKTSDNEILEVEKAVAVKSELIKHVIEHEDCAECVIPLPNVDSKSLAKVMEWCMKHADQNVNVEELKEWDARFVDVDQSVLGDLFRAANHLCIKELINQICPRLQK